MFFSKEELDILNEYLKVNKENIQNMSIYKQLINTKDNSVQFGNLSEMFISFIFYQVLPNVTIKRFASNKDNQTEFTWSPDLDAIIGDHIRYIDNKPICSADLKTSKNYSGQISFRTLTLFGQNLNDDVLVPKDYIKDYNNDIIESSGSYQDYIKDLNDFRKTGKLTDLQLSYKKHYLKQIDSSLPECLYNPENHDYVSLNLNTLFIEETNAKKVYDYIFKDNNYEKFFRYIRNKEQPFITFSNHRGGYDPLTDEYSEKWLGYGEII